MKYVESEARILNEGLRQTAASVEWKILMGPVFSARGLSDQLFIGDAEGENGHQIPGPFSWIVLVKLFTANDRY